MIQTTGSRDGLSDLFTMSICCNDFCTTLEGLSRSEVEEIADLALALLFTEGESYTWHSEFEPNDVY
jgi:hypothetical protein